MIREVSGGEPITNPCTVDPAMLEAAQLMITNMPPIDTGAYRKGFFNGVIFHGNRVSTEQHSLITNMLAEDPRIRDIFKAGEQTCYYWSPQAGSAEERFFDNLREKVVPQVIQELYREYGTAEFPIGLMARFTSRLIGMHIPATGGRSSGRPPVQPWESLKLFTKSHPRIRGREANGKMLLRIMTPRQT